MIISFFNIVPSYLRPGSHEYIPGLGSRLRYMGIGHVEMQVFNSPANDPRIDSYPKWEKQFEETIGTDIEYCKKNGWRIIARGDAIVRTQKEREWVQNCWWSEVALIHVAQRLSESGICDGIEMVDEAGAVPQTYPATKIVQAWRFIGGPPISWPTLNPRLWEVPELSDYNSRQWNWWASKTDADRFKRLHGSLSGDHKGREICAHINLAFQYNKMTLGSYFSPGKDLPVQKPPSVKNISAMFEMARELGATRYRIYSYDYPGWYRERTNEAVSSRKRLQQGTSQAEKRWVGLVGVIKEITSS